MEDNNVTWKFLFRLPTKICFGVGTIENAGTETAQFGRKPLIVAGKNSAQRTGWLEKLLTSLRQADCNPVLFDGVEGNPSVETVDRGGALARKHGCDVVVGLGGGSALDAAKAVALVATNRGPAESFLGSPVPQQNPLPILAIPTTAGSGSEVTANAVITNSKRTAKTSIFHHALIPRVAILDPELTLSVPPALTANTGLDALCHAMEGYLCRASSPMTDLIALEAIRAVFRWLPAAHERGDNVEARAQMLFASLLAGMVISHTRTTIVHNMGYMLTTTYGTHHGLASILLLPAALDVYRPAVEKKLGKVAHAITDDSTSSPNPIARIRQLMNSLGTPSSLADIGAKREDLRAFAQVAAKNQRSLSNTPISLTEQDVLGIYEKAYEAV